MSFQYVNLGPSEAQQYFSRIKGPVLSSVRTAAIDADSGAVLLELGGNPGQEAARCEPPGHYNLILNDDVIAAEGRFTVAEENGGFINLITLHLIMPRSVEDRLDDIKRLMTEGLAVLFSSGMGKPAKVRVTFFVFFEKA